MPAPGSGTVLASVDSDDSTIDCRSAWDPRKVNAVFDPAAQCEPSENLYSFCFTEYDQRWIQMDALDLDHMANDIRACLNNDFAGRSYSIA